MRNKKMDRQDRVLMGLIELFLESGQPIGSNTLKESGFADVSSATIRNDFASLEASGMLEQMHTSGGRVPTAAALRLYANGQVDAEVDEPFDLEGETKEVASFLHGATERLSERLGYPVFLSMPRFDHDLVLEMRLLPLDHSRCLCVLVTDFGSVLTETLATESLLGPDLVKKMEAYFAWRLTGLDKPELSIEERAIASKFYKELMVRYITRYSSFSEADFYRTGFSRLLSYPEFNDAKALAGALSLFENATKMRAILGECVKESETRFWIDEPIASHCSVLALPYFVNAVPVGAVGVLGPTRVPYGKLFGALRLFSKEVSETLSKSLSKFRIHYRQPETGKIYLEQKEQRQCELLSPSTSGDEA